MKINLNVLKDVAKTRPEGYYQDVTSHGKVVGAYLEIDPPAYKHLLQKYSGPEGNVERKSCCGKTLQSGSLNTGSFPPLVQQMRNAIGAVSRLGGAIVHGNQVKATEEEVAKRQAICDGCEYYAKDSQRCQKCGCFLKIKIKLETEHCPIQKW